MQVSQVGISISNGVNYAGIVVGEFNSTYNGKEIIVNSTQGLATPVLKMYGYDIVSGNLVNILLSTNETNTSIVEGITVGDFDGNGIDEIAIYSNGYTDPPVKTFSIINGNQLQTNLTSSESNYNKLWDGITSGVWFWQNEKSSSLNRKIRIKIIKE